MTLALTHALRLARWGRTLGRHGALRAIEADSRAPLALRRLAWLARLGTFAPRTPRYAQAMQAIGPAAIKLGQALATRPDLVGEAAAHDLQQLQDRLPPEPFARVQATLAEAFAQPVAALFTSIEPVAIGAASIAQVHRAVTSDGRTVAIKVLRPGIEAGLKRALDTYEWAAARVEGLGGEAARLRPRATIASFRRWTERELDLRLEAAAASELADDPGHPDIVVPRIDWARTSRRVLTLEWIDGVKMSDPDAVAAAGLDGQRLATTIITAFLHQAIARGFFHADLHQGNLFALSGNRIAIIDFGIMGRLDRRARVDLARIVFGLLTGDYAEVARVHFEAGFVPAHHDPADFATALRAVGEPIRGLPVKDISIANLLDGLFAITRIFEMPTQPHLLLLQKTMVMVEGVAASLDPNVNTWEVAEPYVRRWMRDELGPEAAVADALSTNLALVAQLPHALRRLLALLPPEVAAPPLPTLQTETRLKLPGGWLVAAAAIGAAAAFALGVLAG